jgi:biotin synthase-like enzyme
MMEVQKKTHFERALFFSWYCGRGDCKFCYMSTQKDMIDDPLKARRSKESILAEAIICKNLGWEIEFISGGYESFDIIEIAELLKGIVAITGKNQWINMGVLPEDDLIRLKPYLEGFCGAVECVNKEVHDRVCPSKPLHEIEDMYALCNTHGLKKAMTMIAGIGETIDDFPALKTFIEKNNVSRITFYSLNPHEGTIFTESPSLDYYTAWIKKTRKAFPDINIIAGAWIDKPGYFAPLLDAGADSITKFPAIKAFGSEPARIVEQAIADRGWLFEGSLTTLPDVDWDAEVDRLELDDGLKARVKEKLHSYLRKMVKRQTLKI